MKSIIIISSRAEEMNGKSNLMYKINRKKDEKKEKRKSNLNKNFPKKGK